MLRNRNAGAELILLHIFPPARRDPHVRLDELERGPGHRILAGRGAARRGVDDSGGDEAADGERRGKVHLVRG